MQSQKNTKQIGIHPTVLLRSSEYGKYQIVVKPSGDIYEDAIGYGSIVSTREEAIAVFRALDDLINALCKTPGFGIYRIKEEE